MLTLEAESNVAAISRFRDAGARRGGAPMSEHAS